MLKVIVAGSRSFSNYALVEHVCDNIIIGFFCENFPERDFFLSTSVIIVSGGCRGVDRIAEKYAEEKYFKFEMFKADWNKYGKQAGPIRNGEMAKYADMAVVFWDGESRGSQNMIVQMVRQGKPVHVVCYNNNAGVELLKTKYGNKVDVVTST